MIDPLIAVDLSCEHKRNPLGINVMNPRLTWTVSGEGRNRHQSAYQIRVGLCSEDISQGNKLVWDTDKVVSSNTILIPFHGETPRSAEVYYWIVRLWDETGTPGDWSKPAHWQMGLINKEDWKANWVSMPLRPIFPIPAELHQDFYQNEFGGRPVNYFRKVFDIPRTVKRATLFATAKGVYEAYCNGTPVSDAKLSPGWTQYEKRIENQTYDITKFMQEGRNAIGITLGEGWYSGCIASDRKYPSGHYGSRTSFLGQLLIEFENGNRQWVVTDDTWRVSIGPIAYSDLQRGEACDNRLMLNDWNSVGFDDEHWMSAAVSGHSNEKLVGQIAPPIRMTQQLDPVDWWHVDEGTVIFDMGQNMVGQVRLKTSGPRGTIIRLRHGEMLTDERQLYTENLGMATQTDYYILSGEGEESWQPTFTLHGFRYVEVQGLTQEPTLDTVTGLVIHSDTERTGDFECSHPLVNQLFENINWGQRGNFVSVPTDCPQRGERLGWLGDAQIFVATAAYNYDVSAFFNKWMVDVVDAQQDSGVFSDIAPLLHVFNDLMRDGAPGWSDAGVICPWTIFQRYGDTGILERHYAAMQNFMQHLETENPNWIRENELNNNFGDWLNVDAETDRVLLATAFWALDADIMGQIADVLGHPDDRTHYQALYARIRKAYRAKYIAADGTISNATQTSYLLTLAIGLAPEELKEKILNHLIREIENRDFHLSTGFIGIRYLAPVLSDNGRSDIAYRLLLNETFPSWGYPIKQGATTMWERWDSWTRENGFKADGMNSFNHYAFGSIGEWLYEYMAGIKPLSPGFRQI